MFCTRCGHENALDSRFCARCGAPLVGAGDGGDRGDGGDAVTATSTMSLGSILPAGAAAGTVTAERDDADAASAFGDLEPDDQAAVEGLPAGCAILVVARGPSQGSRYLLDTEVVTAGRQPDSDIFLDDVTVSRRHAELRRADGDYAVRDVGSLNGTYVNKDRIDDVILSDGDEVQIGKFRLVYFASRHAAREEPGR